ncbi:serine hydrolase [Chitinophagaceae bacterium LWZ2-11]
MHLKSLLAIITFHCFFCCIAYTQNTTTITGSVIDASNKQPIAAVSITLNKNSSGTVTNASGAFALSVSGLSTSDTLKVSCIGYSTKYIPVSAMQKNVALNIKLEPNAVELKEAVIEARDPLKLINKAIARIPDNYYNKQHVTTGFYRLAVRKEHDFVQFSEAVFDIYNFGYGDNTSSKFKLIKVRSENDEEAMHGINLGMKPKDIFKSDAVKDVSDNDILSKDGLKYHKFHMEGITDYKGTEAYEISFDQKDGLKKSLYKGKIYLSTQNLVFLCIQYALSPKGMPYSRFGDFGMRALMKIVNIDIDIIKDETKIEYRKIGDRWVLSNFNGNTTLSFKSSRRHYEFPLTGKVDYVITNVDTTARAPFSNQESLGNNKLIEDQTTVYDSAFWKNYNIILPDYNAAEVIAKIKAAAEGTVLKKNFSNIVNKLPKDPAIRIDSMLNYYHSKGRFNGTAVIKYKDKVILNKSYGYADIDKKLQADSNTQYRIGSLSKSFTACVILQLVNEGKLQLTDSLKKYIPYYVHGNVTIEQLLTHQSGIPNYTEEDSALIDIFSKRFTLKEIAVNFCSDSLLFPSGSKFSYSNSGFVILALVAQEVTKKSFAALLRERIFTPAGMNRTYMGDDTLSVPQTHAIGYLYNKVETPYYIVNVAGAGAIVSTAGDLLKYDEALYAGTILPQDMQREMFKPRVEYNEWDAFYGYGWMIDRYQFKSSKKHIINYHPGTDMGFFCMFARQPDAKNAIILLSNAGDFPRFDLTDMILEILN